MLLDFRLRGNDSILQMFWCQHSIGRRLAVICLRVIEGEMQTAAFLALLCGTNDQCCHLGEVSQFQ